MMTSVIGFQWLLAATVVMAEIDMNFIKYPESVTAPVGDSVTFECEVDVPAEKLIWRTRPVDGSEGIWEKVVFGKEKPTEVSTRLVVEVKEDTQSAFYQCVVLYGSVILVSVPAKLSVARLDLSRNSLEKRVITAPPHNTVILHCKEPLSDPPADLSWWKEGSKGSRKPIETPHGVLVIHNTSSSDSGTYGCKATNKLSLKAADLPEKTVLKIQRDDTGEARFTESEDYVGIKDSEGVLTMPVKPRGTLRLYCGVVGTPPPRITWTRQGRTPLNRHDHAILTIANFTTVDEGIYSCSANDIRRSWKVVELQPPRWEGSVANANATEGEGIHINCGTAVGYPQPEVYWLLNGELVTSGKGVTATDSDLHIEHLEKKHAGIVQCFACNHLGCSFMAAMLTVVPLQISDQDYEMEMPKTMQSSSQPKRSNKKNSRKTKLPPMVPPSRPVVTRLSDQSVMLSWSQPKEGLPILFVKVQYKEAMNASKEWNTLTQEIPPHIHSYEVDGLTPNKTYKFRIAAVYSNQDNKQGRSSLRFFLQGGDYKGPSAPVLTKVEATSPHTLQLDWTWSRGEGPETEGFYLCVRAVSSAGAYECVRAPPAARSLALHHFAPDTQYELKLRAYTSQAPSEFSAIKVAKTLKPSNLKTTTTTAPIPEGAAGGTAVGAAGGSGVALGAALGAGGVLIAALLAALLCRRARRLPKHKENASTLEGGGTNGYIPAKVPITITSNPMHSEGSDGGVEMSFLHNNNTGNNDDTLPHSRKNGPTQRQYV